MSHFLCLVIGPDPDSQLAPFNEELRVEKTVEDGEEYWCNPDAKWDWYSFGGRWDGWMKFKSPCASFSTQLKNIDLAAMKDEAGERMGQLYDKMMELTDGKGIPPMTHTWEEVIKRKDLTDEEMREMFHAQPAMAALKAMRTKAWALWEETGRKSGTILGSLSWTDSVEDFIVSRAEAIERARSRSVSPFAILHNGAWYEKGEMGWFGLAANEKPQEVWDKAVAELLDSLDPEVLVTVVDCHI